MIIPIDKGSLLMSSSAWTRISFSGNGFSGKEQDLKGDGQVDDKLFSFFIKQLYIYIYQP